MALLFINIFFDPMCSFFIPINHDSLHNNHGYSTTPCLHTVAIHVIFLHAIYLYVQFNTGENSLDQVVELLDTQLDPTR